MATIIIPNKRPAAPSQRSSLRVSIPPLMDTHFHNSGISLVNSLWDYGTAYFSDGILTRIEKPKLKERMLIARDQTNHYLVLFPKKEDAPFFVSSAFYTEGEGPSDLFKGGVGVIKYEYYENCDQRFFLQHSINLVNSFDKKLLDPISEKQSNRIVIEYIQGLFIQKKCRLIGGFGITPGNQRATLSNYQQMLQNIACGAEQLAWVKDVTLTEQEIELLHEHDAELNKQRLTFVALNGFVHVYLQIPRTIVDKYNGWRQHLLTHLFDEALERNVSVIVMYAENKEKKGSDNVRIFKEIAERYGFQTREGEYFEIIDREWRKVCVACKGL